MKEKVFEYILSLGDNPLILGQRLAEWCGHGPILEVDMALTNISLDLLGQTRNYFQYAAELEGKGRTEDDLAFLRHVGEYKNVLLVEQPNGDFGHTVVRSFLFDAFHELFLEAMQESQDEQLAAIAAKSLKEVKYHLRFSSEWLCRLGDGTEESHKRTQQALEDLWIYGGELCDPSPIDTEMAELGIGVDLRSIAPAYSDRVQQQIQKASLSVPDSPQLQRGGKKGLHTEHMGHLLSDMQWMQRAYPNMKW